jgi:hypothetical protein
LGAIRDKVRTLLERHPVTVVKPIVARKMLLVKDRPDAPVHSRRWSPKRGGWIELFDDLAHFTTVFPHPNLTLEIPLIEIEETRFPRKTRRFWHRAYRIEDQRLLAVIDRRQAKTPVDLLGFVNAHLPMAFDTRQLAEALSTPRGMAQKIAYCLRQTGAISIAGKQGNAMLYRVPASKRQALARVRDSRKPRERMSRSSGE